MPDDNKPPSDKPSSTKVLDPRFKVNYGVRVQLEANMDLNKVYTDEERALIGDFLEHCAHLITGQLGELMDEIYQERVREEQARSEWNAAWGITDENQCQPPGLRALDS